MLVCTQAWQSGLEILIAGAMTAAAAYLIGWGVEEIVTHYAQQPDAQRPAPPCADCAFSVILARLHRGSKPSTDLLSCTDLQ